MFDLENPIMMLLAAAGVVVLGFAMTSAITGHNSRDTITACVSGNCATMDKAEFQANVQQMSAELLNLAE